MRPLHGVLKQSVAAGGDAAAAVSTDEQLLRLSAEELRHVDGAFPDGRRTTESLQLRPVVADHHRHRVRRRNVQLNNAKTRFNWLVGWLTAGWYL